MILVLICFGKNLAIFNVLYGENFYFIKSCSTSYIIMSASVASEQRDRFEIQGSRVQTRLRSMDFLRM